MTIPFDNSYARLPERLFARQAPVPVRGPKIVAVNDALAATLGIDADWLRSGAGLAVLSGNAVPDGAAPLAQVYAGHQFGGWVPRLGDGRAILLGEVTGTDGQRRDIQLKGAGRTPFSRMGDGRAWLGPVLREYLVSEAMAAMGIPTTRALAAVTTGEAVLRDGPRPGAILTRVAASHIRVGTFQYLHAQGDGDGLRALTDHAIARHYPDADGPLALLDAVIAAQARLVAEWMGVGFVHGVMNTDNTAISGETIDYGPCAFLDRYEPGKVFSSIDSMGRYAFNRQADSMVWNLAQFATALLPLIPGDPDSAVAAATASVHRFPEMFRQEWARVFLAKIGIAAGDGIRDGDTDLVVRFLALMAESGADMTNTFRSLCDGGVEDHIADSAARGEWLSDWRARIGGDAGSMERMRSANPALIPRNHRVEAAISAATAEDFAPFERLCRALRHPFDTPADADLRTPPEPDEEVFRTFCGT